MNTELLSLTAVIIALTSTVINYVVLRLHQLPDIIVKAKIDYDRPSILNLIIENVGQGVAFDVRFSTNRPVPERAFGIDLKNARSPEHMKDGPLIDGISSLGAGEKRIITWGQYGGLKKGLSDNVLYVTATYRSKPPLHIYPKLHRTVSTIDIRSFESSDASDRNWPKQIAEQLAKLNKLVESSTDKVTKRIRVDVDTERDD